MATISFKNLNKVYDGNMHAVIDFNLEVKDKEFIVLVGPSGCGKTTTLRMLAGLEDITSGELRIDDEIMNDVAPKDRNIAMVFQNYALYPHMTVYENMAFGLKLRKFSRDEIDRKVQSAASMLGLSSYLDRRPKALSGGQRQRVALGRALVRDAKVFLMDEPLSNLDAKLRVQMRSEIIKLTESLGVTTVYVTHDQIEAMTMASRIVVMKDGLVQQVGTPKDIYDNPDNIFVGGFIGTPPMNFLEGYVSEKGQFVIGDHKKGFVLIEVPKDKFETLKSQGFIEKPIVLGIRPENILDQPEDLKKHPHSIVKLKVDVAELLGAETQIYGVVAGQNLVAKVEARIDLYGGDEVELALNMDRCHFFDPETEARIKKY